MPVDLTSIFQPVPRLSEIYTPSEKQAKTSTNFNKENTGLCYQSLSLLSEASLQRTQDTIQLHQTKQVYNIDE